MKFARSGQQQADQTIHEGVIQMYYESAQFFCKQIRAWLPISASLLILSLMWITSPISFPLSVYYYRSVIRKEIAEWSLHHGNTIAGK